MPSKSASKGYLALVLHSHLPFVRHPEYEDCLEEDWLYEAITETYIPLLRVFEGLVRDKIAFRLTVSLSPPLVTMLTDALLQQRYVRHIERLIELADKEVRRTRSTPEFHQTAQMYLRKFRECRRYFVDDNRGDLVRVFRDLQESGHLEIITCSATHGFLPLLNTHPQIVRAQVAIGAKHYESTFSRRSAGMWNAECGYFPGLEKFLAAEGVRYFFVDAHGILYADKPPRYGVFAPLVCDGGVAAFGRDLESSRSVWSSEEGYPGDPNYREFYRDIGYDLDFDYVKPYIHDSGLRISTGIKYYRITGRGSANKKSYSERAATDTARRHAADFVNSRIEQIEYLAPLMDRPPIIVAPYDAELFGHWWYEGPQFLDQLFRALDKHRGVLEPITPATYLERHPDNQWATPSLSSWGNKGYSEVWLEGSNDWIYRHLHKAGERMIQTANRFPQPSDTQRRLMNQMARELLLAQSSDWAFIMKTGTMVDYATRRTKDHLLNFNDLCEQLRSGMLDETSLGNLESKNKIFPDIDFRVYAADE